MLEAAKEVPQWTCLLHHQHEKQPEIIQITRLTRRGILLVRGIRRSRGRRAIDIHGFLLFQPPSFAVLLFPFAFLSEHGLQVLSSSVLVFRVLWVLERFRDMEV